MKHHSLSGCIFMQNGSVFHYSIGKTQAQANFMISYQFPCSFPRADFMLARKSAYGKLQRERRFMSKNSCKAAESIEDAVLRMARETVQMTRETGY